MRSLPFAHLLRPIVGAFLISLSAFAGTASAQYKIETWTAEQGLPQSSVGSVAQTPDGFIWATTLGGLVRFDGVRFRVYDTATNPELPNSRLASMFADETGGLWITTQDSEVLRFRAGKFHKAGPVDGFPAGVLTKSKTGNRRVIETTEGAVIVEKNGQLAPYALPGPPASLGLRYMGAAADGARWFVEGQPRSKWPRTRRSRSARAPTARCT